MLAAGRGDTAVSSFEGTLIAPTAPPRESDSRSDAVVVDKGVKGSSIAG